jgi:hypothetical protein
MVTETAPRWSAPKSTAFSLSGLSLVFIITGCQALEQTGSSMPAASLVQLTQQVSFQSMVFPRWTSTDTDGLVSALAGPSVPQCRLVSGEIRNQWQEASRTIRLGEVLELSMRLPKTFARRPSAESLGPFPPKGVTWEFENSNWEFIVDSWVSETVSPVDRGFASDLALWMGGSAGYPTVAYPPQARISAEQECSVSVQGSMRYIKSFAVQDQNSPTSYYLAAYWRLPEKTWVRLLGQSTDPTVRDQLASVVETVRFHRHLDTN